jgi:hypothetical protein
MMLTILREQQALIEQGYQVLKGAVFDGLLNGGLQAANDAVFEMRRMG